MPHYSRVFCEKWGFSAIDGNEKLATGQTEVAAASTNPYPAEAFTVVDFFASSLPDFFPSSSFPAASNSLRSASPTFGYAKFSDCNVSTITVEITSRVNDLLSAGTTYHGASFGSRVLDHLLIRLLIVVPISALAHVRRPRTSSSFPVHPAVPENASSVLSLKHAKRTCGSPSRSGPYAARNTGYPQTARPKSSSLPAVQEFSRPRESSRCTRTTSTSS